MINIRRFILDLIFGVTPWGGISAFDSLTYPDLIPSETGTTFEYVGVANLLSYVVREASGLTPEEFANAKLFPFLGITASDYEWEKTNDGTNTAWHGLSMNVPAMAKLGQLYLQNGFHNSETTVLNEDWVERTITGTEPNPAYGYHWWISEPNLRPHRFCAEGAGEQRICVDQELNRVYAVLSYDDSSEAAFVLWELVAMLSFSEPSNGQVKTLPEYPTGIAIEESVREKFEKAMAEERKLMEK